MRKDKRGLRFDFHADAEVRVEGATSSSRGRVKELSLRGCFVETAGAFSEHQRVRVNIFNAGEDVESPAEVIYVRPGGIGLLFVDATPGVRDVLQKWVLTALDRQGQEAPVR